MRQQVGRAKPQRRKECVTRTGLSRIALVYLVGKVEGAHERECQEGASRDVVHVPESPAASLR